MHPTTQVVVLSSTFFLDLFENCQVGFEICDKFSFLTVLFFRGWYFHSVHG